LWQWKVRALWINTVNPTHLYKEHKPDRITLEDDNEVTEAYFFFFSFLTVISRICKVSLALQANGLGALA
jgi:hypothetical protein